MLQINSNKSAVGIVKKGIWNIIAFTEQGATYIMFSDNVKKYVCYETIPVTNMNSSKGLGNCIY